MMREREAMKKKRKNLIMIWLVLALLVLLGACGARSRGQTVVYDGFTVRTERSKEVNGEAVSPSRSLPLQPAGDGEREQDYVLNTGSKKFHLPDCASVGSIKEKNRWDYHGTRASALEMGYEPCRICEP